MFLQDDLAKIEHDFMEATKPEPGEDDGHGDLDDTTGGDADTGANDGLGDEAAAADGTGEEAPADDEA